MRKVFSYLLSASLLASLWAAYASEQITISEFLASNTGGLRDEDQAFSDWIELRNSGTNTVNLDGWFLTDNDNNLTKWRIPNTNIASGGFIIVFADSKDRAVPGAPLHANFALSASGEYLALVKPDGVTIATEFRQVNDGYPAQVPNVSYGFSSITTNITVVTTNATLRVRIPVADEGTNWTTPNYNDSAWIAGTNAVGYGSYGSLLRTDVRAAMSNINASAYIRIPFTVNAPSNASLITLRVRYNDGLAAYINGLEAVRLNAPTPLSFNSGATATHSTLGVEEFRLGTTALVEGTNILAIHALNNNATDSNFLVQAELILASIEAESPIPMYFTLPSPGSNNVAGVANPGPAILEPSHTPNTPTEEENITVTARVSPTFAVVATVALRYRVMYNAETEIPMFDDGLHGDGNANDGIFGATIPAATAASAGQMVRWHIRATDTQGRPSRWPIFAASTHTEYLGTVVAPDYVTSKLPIVHLFAATGILNPGPNAGGAQPGADSEPGGRVSLFHLGEFYDNVQMSLRGNSTAGFEKKSHRIEFNPDHPFRHTGPGPRIRKTSFVADYNDPTYMRQGLCYWLGDLIGAPSPFYIPHRLQLNGQFYQLANFNDVNGEELLERLGYDPRGALYKAQGRVTNPVQSTGQPEKLTRRTEPNTDYIALADGISDTLIPNPINRKTNVFEQFDIPQLINYVVTARWSHENDDVWANMTLYRDTEGDQLWRIIPFDMNLAWGAIFAEGSPAELYTGVQSTNDTHKSHPLYGGSTILARSGPGGAWNRVYDVSFQIPELREMVLRRMRTMLDKYIGPPGTPINTSPAEQRILVLYDLIYEEAINDRAWWGWRNVGGQNNFPPPPNPGTIGTATRTNAAIYSITNGVAELLRLFVRPRRQHFYERHSITNTRAPLYNGAINPASNTVAGIPFAQPTNVVVNIGRIESNPSSGFQGHEFIQITNPNPFAVDISGWKLSNGVSFTFKPGTVLGSNGVLYMTPDLKSFRTRTTTPRSGQALLVVGDYRGQLDARGEPLTLLDETGRIVHTNTYVPSPSPAQLYLRITEMMYHPAPAPAGSPYPQEEFEYLELKNIGPVNLNLVGIHFTNGISFTFRANSLVTNLAPGQIVVLVKNGAAFTSRHGSGATIAGVYSNNLSNAGERISLHDAVGEQILDFTYDNSWYPVTDGLGFSLVIVNENADWTTWDLKEAWRPSATDLASPGADDPPAPGPFAPMLVNEVLANTDFPDVDRIEIYNPTANAVDIGNWWISDDQFTPHKYRIPAPRMVPAGGFAVFTESDFNVGPNAFSFSSRGDDAFLFSGDSAGNLNGYVHGFDFGDSDPGVSFGRYVNSQTNTHFVAQSSNTFGFSNARPRVGPVVISEIMYRPPDLGTNDNDFDEYVELQNISTNAVPLYDPAFPTNRWELDDAIHFRFPAGTAIPAGGFLVAVSFDPANASALARFRSLYGLGTNVAIVGPYTDNLNNSEGRVELKRPDTSDITNVGLVLIDRVHYRDSAPWDANADGLGAALQRIVPADYGNDPTNWLATVPNPGARVIGGALPVITSQPVNTTAVAGRTTNSFSVTATGAVRFQWQANGTNIHGATNFTLVLTNVSPAQAGVYRAIALNGAGLAFSSNALLTVLAPVTFTVQPASQRVQPGTNVTITASAIGSGGGGGSVSYQWQFAPYTESGVLQWSDIPNATSAAYSFTGANLNQHHGSFRVIAYDNLSATISAEAFIYVAVRPGFVVQPTHVTIVQGGTAVFTAMATGAPPIFYRWIRNGIGVVTSTVPVLVLNNVQIPTPNPLPIRVAATNLASGVGGVNSGTVNLLVHPDFDGDGAGDPWEAQYGFNTNNLADGAADPDGDGASNRDEYVAGTDPLNGASVLRLERVAANGALQFVAQSNLTYTLQWRTNLALAAWTSLTNVAGATNGVRTIQVTVPNPPPDWERYYRVATPLVP